MSAALDIALGRRGTAWLTVEERERVRFACKLPFFPAYIERVDYNRFVYLGTRLGLRSQIGDGNSALIAALRGSNLPRRTYSAWLMMLPRFRKLRVGESLTNEQIQRIWQRWSNLR